MQRRKKQLLGFLGLAFVVAMTIFAYALPAPGASAAESSVKLKVEVVMDGDLPQVEIVSIENGEVVVNKSFDVTIKYLRATELKVSITNNGAVAEGDAMALASRAAETVELDLTGSSCSKEAIATDDAEEFNSWRECVVRYELPGDLAGAYGINFMTQATAINGNFHNSANSDPKTLVYRAAKFADKVQYDSKNGDPIISIEMSSDVKNGTLVVFDKDGNPIFGNSATQNGQYPAIPFEGYTEGNGGKVNVTLPFGEKELATGDYQVVLIAYSDKTNEDGSAEVVALATADVKYYATDDPHNPSHPNYNPNDPDNPFQPGDPNNPNDPNNPSAPNTGSIFGELNISRADYIVTGLMAFGIVTGFAFFLILRRNKR